MCEFIRPHLAALAEARVEPLSAENTGHYTEPEKPIDWIVFDTREFERFFPRLVVIEEACSTPDRQPPSPLPPVAALSHRTASHNNTVQAPPPHTVNLRQAEGSIYI